jgi:hypothetical protein
VEEKVFISTAKDRLYVRRGGTVEMAAGSKFVSHGGTQPLAIADVDTGGSATAAANATAINQILAVLRSLNIIAT